ncbi:hypothetical protein FQR65_LT08026 [Abscondita terminalis]|nr:hypothetical protein FQR65_LT08026 [Abscondita terminalis]
MYCVLSSNKIVWEKIFAIDDESSLRTCLSLIIEQSFDDNQPLTFTSSDDNLLLIPKQNGRTYTVINLDIISTVKFSHDTQFVVFVNDMRNLNKFITRLTITNFHLRGAPKSRIVIVTDSMNAKSILKRMWLSKLINVAIVYYSKGSVPFISMSNPFERKNVCGKAPRVVVTQKCDQKVTKLRFEKHKNLNNCTIGFLNIFPTDHVTNIIPQLVFAEIEKIFNTRVVFAKTYSEVTKILKYLVFMFLASEDDSLDYVEIFADDIVWVSPLFKRIVTVTQNIFDLLTWGMILLIFSTTFIAWWGITTVRYKRNCWWLSVLNVWSLTICGGIETPPTSRHLRTIFILYLFGVIVIQTAFQSKITNDLTLSEYSSDIKTIEDVANSPLPLIVHKAIPNIFGLNTFKSVLLTKIQNKLSTDVYPVVLKHNTLSGPYKVYIGLGKGHFFTEHVRNVTTLMVESGFYTKTFTDFHSKNYRRFRVETPDLVVLNFKHVYQIFIIWGVGMLASGALFIMEKFF